MNWEEQVKKMISETREKAKTINRFVDLEDLAVNVGDEIKNLIGADKIEEALNLLRGRYDERSEIILLMNRLNRFEENGIKHVNTHQEESVEHARLVDDVLRLLNRLEKEE